MVVVTHAKFLEENVRQDHVLGVALDLVCKFAGTGAGNFFDEAGSFFPDSVVGGVGLKSIEVLRHCSDVLVDGPLVIV